MADLTFLYCSIAIGYIYADKTEVTVKWFKISNVEIFRIRDKMDRMSLKNYERDH